MHGVQAQLPTWAVGTKDALRLLEFLDILHTTMCLKDQEGLRVPVYRGPFCSCIWQSFVEFQQETTCHAVDILLGEKSFIIGRGLK